MGCSNTKLNTNVEVPVKASDVQLSCGKEAADINVVQEEKFAEAIECIKVDQQDKFAEATALPKHDEHAMMTAVYNEESSLCVQRAIASALLNARVSARAGLLDEFYGGLGMTKVGPALWSTPTSDSTSTSTDKPLPENGKSSTVVPSSPLTADTRASPPAMPARGRSFKVPSSPVPSSSPTAPPDNAAPTTQSSFAAATSLPPPSLPKALLDAPGDKPSLAPNLTPFAVTAIQWAPQQAPSREDIDNANMDDASPPPKVEPTASTEWIEAHLRLANMHPGGQRPASAKKGKKKKSLRQSGSSGNLSPRGGSVTISIAGGSGGRSLK